MCNRILRLFLSDMIWQGNGSALLGALQSAGNDGWAGFGFPTTPGVMEGASAIVVKACASCASGNVRCGYLMSIFWCAG